MGLVFALFLIIAIPAIAYYDLRQTSGAEPFIYRPVAPATPVVSRVEQAPPEKANLELIRTKDAHQDAFDALIPADNERRLDS